MSQKVQIPVYMPLSLSRELKSHMAIAGFKPREKSKWISEHLRQFVDLGPQYILDQQLLDLGWISRFESDVRRDVITVDDELSIDIDSLLIGLRQLDPYLNPTRSQLIRAAIVYRLREGAGDGQADQAR